MAYSIDSIPDNCYEGTSCLINKLDIRDEEKLNFVESQITIQAANGIDDNLMRIFKNAITI